MTGGGAMSRNQVSLLPIKQGLGRYEPAADHWRRMQEKKARADKLAVDKLKRKQGKP